MLPFLDMSFPFLDTSQVPEPVPEPTSEGDTETESDTESDEAPTPAPSVTQASPPTAPRAPVLTVVSLQWAFALVAGWWLCGLAGRWGGAVLAALPRSA